MSAIVEAIKTFFESVFGNAYLVGFIISMIPLIELKGGIIYMIMAAGSKTFLTYLFSFLVGLAGSTLVAPILLFAFLPLIRWMKTTRLLKGLAAFLEKYFMKKSKRLEEKAEIKAQGVAATSVTNATSATTVTVKTVGAGQTKEADEAALLAAEARKKKVERAKYLGLFLFTAIPLPLTGCWTASVVASVLQLDYKKSLLFIFLGNVVAGILITLLGGVLGLAFFR